MWSNDIKHGLCTKFDGIVGWNFGKVIVDGVDREVFDEVHTVVGDEVGGVFYSEVDGKVVSINM